MIRLISKLLIVVLIVAIINGCSKSLIEKESNQTISQTTNQQAKVKLRWLAQWYGEGDKEKFIREIVRDFEFLNQDVEIELTFPAQVIPHNNSTELFNNYNDSIVKMNNSGNWNWDVLLCDKYNYNSISVLYNDIFWGKDKLVDFSQKQWFIDSHKAGIVTEDFKNSYGGIIPGPIIEGVSQVLFVSTKVEELLGINVKRTDMKFSDFLSYAKTVTEYNKTHEPKITFFCALNEYSNMLFTQLLMSAYGKLISENKQDAVNALELTYKSLEELVPQDPLKQYIDFGNLPADAAGRILKEDKYLFNLKPTWVYQFWKNNNPEGIKYMKPCEIPSLDNKKSPCYAGFFQSVFCVPQASKNKEAAERLMKFIASTANAEKWISYSKCPTGMKTKISFSDFGQDDFAVFYQHIQNKYGNNQFEVNLPKVLFNSDKQLDFRINDILSGSITSNMALKQIEKQLR